MLRKINFYSICFAFGLSVLLILAGSRYTDNPIYRPGLDGRKYSRNYYGQEDKSVTINPYDKILEKTNIDKILEKTSDKIKLDLRDYNFTFSGIHQLEDLLMEAGGQPLRSLIISTWRSGTTFLGDLLNAMPGNFYHYEPFLNYGVIQVRGPPNADKTLDIIKNMFLCNFKNMGDYFEYGKNHLEQFMHNTRLWDHCRYKKELCLDEDFTMSYCKLFPFQSMKLVRVRLRLIDELLRDTRLNVKVVLLIRDPRGVMQSRIHRDFCQPAPDCWEPELLCADMISDYVAASRLLQNYPNRLMVLRYEELALKPNNTAQDLLKFLGLSSMQSVYTFLQTHTNNEIKGVSSTYRISHERPFRWKNLLQFQDVENIQLSCQEAMSLWGYQLAHNASHMKSKEFNPLQPYSIKL